MQNCTFIGSGTGTRFYYVFGSLKAIQESYNINNYILASGSGLIGTTHAVFKHKYSINKIERILKSFDLEQLQDRNILFPFIGTGLLEGELIKQALYQIFKDLKFKDIDSQISLILSDFTNNVEIHCSSKTTPNFAIYEALRACISIPLIFKTDKYKLEDLNKELYLSDGMVFNNFPVNLNENELAFGVRLVNNEVKYNINNIFDVIMKTFDNLIRAKELESIKDAKNVNIIEIISNENPLNFKLSYKDKERMIESGYNQTKEYLKNLKILCNKSKQ